MIDHVSPNEGHEPKPPDDAVSEKNLCTAADANLVEITIPDLSCGKIQENSILWAKNLSLPAQRRCVKLVIQDKEGEAMCLDLHNQVKANLPIEELEDQFPEGARIGIKQPYLTRTANGNLCLRNDNPPNIIILPEEEDDSDDEPKEVSNED